MNNIITNFSQILKFAQQYNLPLGKKRAILREYLQMKILDTLYQHPKSTNLIFIGGTSLRITKNLDRFSEDLDFDLDQTNTDNLDQIIEHTRHILETENFPIDFYRNQTQKRRYYEFRFKSLLHQLKISNYPDEKLTIKFDFEHLWKFHPKTPILINRYGFLVNIISIPLNQFLVQKLTAYLHRKQTQPRDIYDIVWLKAQGAQIDQNFIQKNNLPKDLVAQVIDKFTQEKAQLSNFQRRLKPFLINENYANKLELLPQLLAQSSSTEKPI